MKRILVTGSRGWTDAPTVISAICGEIPDETLAVIVHGACPTGADAIASGTAVIMKVVGVTEEPHPANWNLHGKAAGPLRNQEMVDLGADVCLAFPLGESRGTRDCMRRAEKAGIPVKVFEGKASSD